MTGVNPSAIRYWEKNVKELTPQKSRKGTRLFSQNDIETVRLINYLIRERGLTIKGARQKLSDNREETIKNWEIVQRLQKIKDELTAVREKMD